MKCAQFDVHSSVTNLYYMECRKIKLIITYVTLLIFKDILMVQLSSGTKSLAPTPWGRLLLP